MDVSKQQVRCSECGCGYPAGAAVCPACGVVNSQSTPASDDCTERARAGDRLKTQWVVAVVAFWVSASLMVVMFYLDGGLNPILASITLGMLFIGVRLKAKYQRYYRKYRLGHSANVDPD